MLRAQPEAHSQLSGSEQRADGRTAHTSHSRSCCAFQPSRADGSRSVTFQGASHEGRRFNRDEPKARGLQAGSRGLRLRPVRRSAPGVLDALRNLTHFPQVWSWGSRLLAQEGWHLPIDRQRHVPSVSDRAVRRPAGGGTRPVSCWIASCRRSMLVRWLATAIRRPPDELAGLVSRWRQAWCHSGLLPRH